MKRLFTIFVMAALMSITLSVEAQENEFKSNDELVGKDVIFPSSLGIFMTDSLSEVCYMKESGALEVIPNDEVKERCPELFDKNSVYHIGNYYELGERNLNSKNDTVFWSKKYLPFITQEHTYYLLCENEEGSISCKEKSYNSESRHSFLSFFFRINYHKKKVYSIKKSKQNTYYSSARSIE